MERNLVLPVLLLCVCQIVWASAREQDYTASKQAVFNAAVKVIQKDWNITFMDRESGIISFKTGTSLRSNGMECQVSVIEVSASQTKLRVGAQKTGGQLVAWGAGGSIASKVFKGVEDELKSSTPAALTPSAPAVAPIQPASNPPVQEATGSKPSVSSAEPSERQAALTPSSPAVAATHPASVASTQPTSLTTKQADSQPVSVAPTQPNSIATAQPAPSSAPRQAASSSALEQATVEFWSSPAGAAIELDGKYIGSTPSTITVPAGEHTITMRKQDFGTWQKTMKVTSGNLRVAAYMQQVGVTLH